MSLTSQPWNIASSSLLLISGELDKKILHSWKQHPENVGKVRVRRGVAVSRCCLPHAFASWKRCNAHRRITIWSFCWQCYIVGWSRKTGRGEVRCRSRRSTMKKGKLFSSSKNWNSPRRTSLSFNVLHAISKMKQFATIATCQIHGSNEVKVAASEEVGQALWRKSDIFSAPRARVSNPILSEINLVISRRAGKR